MTRLLIESFVLGMVMSAALLVAYWYVVLKPEPEQYDETPKFEPYAPPKARAYNWAKDERYGVLKGKKRALNHGRG